MLKILPAAIYMRYKTDDKKQKHPENKITFLPRDDRGLFPARSLNQARIAPWFLAACFMMKKITFIEMLSKSHHWYK